MAFLELESLTKRFGDFVAVEEFNLSVDKGEFICLLGPSGCGKTTTLQMVAGLVQPTSGRIELDGRDITKLRSNRRANWILKRLSQLTARTCCNKIWLPRIA